MKLTNSFIFFIVLLKSFLNASLFNSLLVHTQYKNISELSLDISKPEFFYNYLKIVKAEEINFDPSVENKNIIKFPQEITYKCIPDIPLIPKTFGKIKIKQLWKLSNNDFIGTITSDLITFNVKIIPFLYKEKVSLIFQGNLINKSFFVPSQVLNQILLDMERIFNIILNNNFNQDHDDDNLEI